MSTRSGPGTRHVEAPGTKPGRITRLLGGGLLGWVRRHRGPVTFVIGLLLIAGAIWAVLGDAPKLEAAVASFREAPVWLVLCALLLPVCNLVVVSVAFWALTRRHGVVGVGEMGALITGAWLLNHLPMRAGMIGRLTYHKTVNRISLKASLRVVIEGVLISVGAILTSLALAWVIESRETPWAPLLSTLVLGSPLVLASLALLLAPGLWAWTLTFICRYLDALIWAARYAVVFAVVGAPIGYVEAVFFGGITQVVGLLPIAGNGLGVREWTVGVTAGVFGAAAETTGIAADLINRGAELIVGVPLGIAATAWVGRRIARHRHDRSDRARAGGAQKGSSGSVGATNISPGPIEDPGRSEGPRQDPAQDPAPG